MYECIVTTSSIIYVYMRSFVSECAFRCQVLRRRGRRRRGRRRRGRACPLSRRSFVHTDTRCVDIFSLKMITGKKFGLSARLRHRLGATRHVRPHSLAQSATKTLTPTTKIHRDLASFITDASARSLIRQALRATRSLADAQTRESAVEEIKRTVRATVG